MSARPNDEPIYRTLKRIIMRMTNNVRKEKKELAICLFDRGNSIKNIAKKTNISLNTAGKWINEYKKSIHYLELEELNSMSIDQQNIGLLNMRLNKLLKNPRTSQLQIITATDSLARAKELYNDSNKD